MNYRMDELDFYRGMVVPEFKQKKHSRKVAAILAMCFFLGTGIFAVEIGGDKTSEFTDVEWVEGVGITGEESMISTNDVNDTATLTVMHSYFPDLFVAEKIGDYELLSIALYKDTETNTFIIIDSLYRNGDEEIRISQLNNPYDYIDGEEQETANSQFTYCRGKYMMTIEHFSLPYKWRAERVGELQALFNEAILPYI